MATIQIRNVPEEVHRTFQTRAAAAGQSLQEYLLSYLIEHASHGTPQEIVAEVERDIDLHGGDGFAPSADVHEIVHEDRESH